MSQKELEEIVTHLRTRLSNLEKQIELLSQHAGGHDKAQEEVENAAAERE